MNTNSGFRLDRFEVYNWGTFDEKVWVMEPKGFSALLTGENGSGKSTLVDGLLTLLVQNSKRNYNLASGSEKKERTELTYVRGAYAKEQSELGKGQTKYLRKETDYSVLLARFENSFSQNSITMGAFFWFEEATLHKLFFISHSCISIHSHFSQIKNTKELRSRLKNIPLTTIFSTFTEYQTYFVKYVGLRSEKGLDLFNQITAIKEISRLNEFVRKHMLNANDALDLLDSLYKNYQNLELSYQAIVLAKNQLDELNPLSEEAKKFKGLDIKIKHYQQERQTLPFFFATHKKEALTQHQVQILRNIRENETRLADIEFKINSLNQQKLELTRLFSQDKKSQELEGFSNMLSQLEEKKEIRQKQAAYYARIGKILGIPTDPNLKEFSKTLESVQETQSKLEAQLTDSRGKLYQKKKEQENFLKQLEGLIPEVQSLKTRQNRLPMPLIRFREELLGKLGIATKTLPFIAELIQVQDPAWEGAIEKLLHSFALRMLVPQDLYPSVSKFLNNTNTGIRLIFQKVDEQGSYKSQTPLVTENEKLFHKLKFQTKSPYIHWIKDQIIKNFDYSCVDQLALFQKQFKAMTSKGLMKHGLSLNEKDDRFSIQDKSRFILGWDNHDRLDWALKEIQTHQKAYDCTSQEVKVLEKSIQSTEQELISLRDLSQIHDYSSIDWKIIANEIEKIKQRQSVFLENHQKSGTIQKNLEKIELDLLSAQKMRDSYLKEMAVMANTSQTLITEIEFCEKTLKLMKEPIPSSAWLHSFIAKRKLKLLELPLREYALVERAAQDELDSLALKSEEEKHQLQISLVRKMTHFKTRFSEQAADLDTTLDSLPEYLDLQKNLEAESLPEHERRFKKLLSKSVMNDIAAFKSTLDLAFEEIEETISQLNIALRGIRYSADSYVQLQSARNKDVEVREFHYLIKQCLLDARQEQERPAQLEQCFEKIKLILDRLKNEERWSKKVTDVRNWADFSVQEKFQENHEPKNFYSDSAGLSGGQKAKLAFTILASAIAYQYGLKISPQISLPEMDSSKPTTGANSFRFIVVDEAFSKSDEKNSRYAMELFQSLGLQVMVVTPKDKLHIVEPYVHSIFLTYMQEAQERSQLVPLSLEKTLKNQISKKPRGDKLPLSDQEMKC